MNLSERDDSLRLPESLSSQLYAFRWRVWTLKSLEAICIAVLAVVGAFFCVFLLDRFWDTPNWLRGVVFLGALVGCAAIPWFSYRWIWRQRRLEQLALLLGRAMPHLGDQLLGVIELARSQTEQARSRRLCEAAIAQVAADSRRRDLTQAIPVSGYRVLRRFAIGAAVLAVCVAVFLPSAAKNAWARFLAPWSDTPRYTFAAVDALPDELVVPHGEPFRFSFRLQDDSSWRPATSALRIGSQQSVQTELSENGYAFELPPQIDEAWMRVDVGDASHRIRLIPKLRPELESVIAMVALPSYLGRSETLTKDARGGSVSLVRGSQATITATAARRLSSGTIDGVPRLDSETTIVSPPVDVEASRELTIAWRDAHDLAGESPFQLAIDARDDEAPSISCEGLPRMQVVLDSEQLSFRVTSQDDFGVKQVGMEWEGKEQPTVSTPAQGERIVAAGAPDKEALNVTGTFSASSLGIEPQPIVLRMFAEDYFVGRERVYSAPHVLFVLTAEQHAIWMTNQLSKWHRHSLEVRDREMQLYETNKNLRDLPADELDQPETRRRIEQQASAERANGQRLSRLTSGGEELIRQASRNPEFGVGHLEKWAEMLQILKDISANRMPTVADMLNDAADAKEAVAGSESKQAPMAGQVRANPAGSAPPEDGEEKKETPAVPVIADVESTQQPSDENAEAAPPKETGGAPSLGLPTTTLLGGGPKDDTACPTGEKLDEAVVAQEDLLAEFERISDELNKVLANLEGSTLVKRLKAVSREEYGIGGKIGEQIDDTFGLSRSQVGTLPQKVFQELANLQNEASVKVSSIMDDMQAYFQRRRMAQFKMVLDDMNELDVVGSLRRLAEDIPQEHGLSIAQTEYWSDSLDRWAEDLVDPASGGT